MNSATLYFTASLLLAFLTVGLSADPAKPPTSGPPRDIAREAPQKWDARDGTVLVPPGKMLTRDGRVVDIADRTSQKSEAVTRFDCPAGSSASEP